MPNPTPSNIRTPTPSVPAHKPYVPDEKIIPEFTWSAVLVGAVLGIIFGASSLYLVLKVGMTISASIPVAVSVDHAVSSFLAYFRHSPGDDLGKQYCADNRLGRRIDRLRRGHNDAGGDDLGLRDGNLPE